jgi:hypothetical protein
MPTRSISLPSGVRFAVLTGVVVSILLGGCTKKKIDSVSPDLLVTVRISLATSGAQGNLDCVNDTPGISSDGRYIAFTSKAFNLVPNDNNNAPDVFYRDNVNRTTVLVSVNRFGTGTADGASSSPWMSGDGRYVSFASRATNLTLDAIPLGTQQIYVRDMFLGTTTLVSRATNTGGVIADQDCFNPKISNDGSTVIFDTMSNVLDTLDVVTTTVSHVYYRKWLDAPDGYPTVLVDFVSGTNSGSGNVGTGNAVKGCLSADGRYAAFESAAPNLVQVAADGGMDQNSKVDVFVRDTMTFRTVRCSVPAPGFVELGNPAVGDSQSFEAPRRS